MPWWIIVAIVGGVIAIGLLFFALMRRRTGGAGQSDAKFSIIRLPEGSVKSEGKDVFYIVSEGRMIRVTPHQDDAGKP